MKQTKYQVSIWAEKTANFCFCQHSISLCCCVQFTEEAEYFLDKLIQ